MKAHITVRSIPTFQPEEKPTEIVDTACKGLVLRIQPSGVATFYSVYRVDGKNKRFRIGSAGHFETDSNNKYIFRPGIHPDVARDIAREKAGEAAKGDDPQEIRKEKRAKEKVIKIQSVGGFFEKVYEPFLTTERKSGKATAQRIRSNFGWLFDKPMTVINPFLLAGWRKKQLEAKKSPATVNRVETTLKALLSKAVELGVIEIHPLAKFKPIRGADRQVTRYLAPDEEKRLLEALIDRDVAARQARLNFNKWREARRLPALPVIDTNQYSDHLTPLVLTALHTGARRGELFSLKWKDIDLIAGRITIKAENAKTAKIRHIPINDTLRSVLTQWKEKVSGIELVFPSPSGKRLTNVQSSWDNLMVAAKIPDFTFHCLRHSFASKALQNGGDIVAISRLLGHSDLKMTLRYSHLSDNDLRKTVNLLSAV